MFKAPFPSGANLQKLKNEERTYSISPHISGGLTNAQTLKKIATVAEKYNCGIKITSGQQIKLMGLKADQVDDVWADLEMEPKDKSGLKCKGVRFCSGNRFCKRAALDSVRLGRALEDKYLGMELPSRLKMGVSGCSHSCTAPAIRDIGIVGDEDGFEVRVGGSGGSKPRLAKPLAYGLNQNQTLALVEQIINVYKAKGRVKERLGDMIERISWIEFSTQVKKDQVKELIPLEKFKIENKQKNASYKCQHE
ncbi:NAD(P)H-nitrite reductase [Halobacteroides halobius DSM 5150]|uniref:NAD(P)H-nitrite reductase n=1 Tax=Halobacteroides halobius (strain ATCC 35273 / DSM 5150 / MD-1) TaxID=748449 RepID=L0K9X5_HALHC|nr:NAD(P)/FAD-dependent oxidoreductase [Halobacteroides halobius]AGB41179.1 NAD(P)H-nitrite reductase [Halobacteroides halobius DSM 5150]